MQKGRQMKHIKIDGKSDLVLFLLHGTGGDKESLLSITQYISPDATLIGLDGTVMEQGMRRYFSRYADGSFDLESLKEGTDLVQTTIQGLVAEYGLENKKIGLLGYSNGANLAVNLFKEYETDYDYAILFHPSPGRAAAPFKPQSKLKVLATSGVNDPYISELEFKQLTDALEQAGIKTETLTHEQGHSLTQAELSSAKQFLSES